MTWGMIAVAGAGLIGGAMASNSADNAADTQLAGTQAGIAENSRQFDKLQQLLSPYVQGGNRGLDLYMQLSGANGTLPQQQRIDLIQNGPQFTSLAKQGEDAILQNASATGGLRGGNVQGALANYRTNLLSSLIDKQLSQYGGLASMGQNSAAGVGSAALTTGQNNASLMQQGAAAQAGGIVAGNNAITSSLGNVAGIYAGRQASAVTPAPTAASAIGGGGGFGSGVVYGNQDLGQYF